MGPWRLITSCAKEEKGCQRDLFFLLGMFFLRFFSLFSFCYSNLKCLIKADMVVVCKKKSFCFPTLTLMHNKFLKLYLQDGFPLAIWVGRQLSLFLISLFLSHCTYSFRPPPLPFFSMSAINSGFRPFPFSSLPILSGAGALLCRTPLAKEEGERTKKKSSPEIPFSLPLSLLPFWILVVQATIGELYSTIMPQPNIFYCLCLR